MFLSESRIEYRRCVRRRGQLVWRHSCEHVHPAPATGSSPRPPGPPGGLRQKCPHFKGHSSVGAKRPGSCCAKKAQRAKYIRVRRDETPEGNFRDVLDTMWNLVCLRAASREPEVGLLHQDWAPTFTLACCPSRPELGSFLWNSGRIFL